MKAIVTRYFGWTATKPTRIVAEDGDGHRVVVSVSTGNDADHEEAVKALCKKMKWHGDLVQGSIRYKGRPALVWVFVDHTIHQGRITAKVLSVPKRIPEEVR